MTADQSRGKVTPIKTPAMLYEQYKMEQGLTPQHEKANSM